MDADRRAIAAIELVKMLIVLSSDAVPRNKTSVAPFFGKVSKKTDPVKSVDSFGRVVTANLETRYCRTPHPDRSSWDPVKRDLLIHSFGILPFRRHQGYRPGLQGKKRCRLLSAPFRRLMVAPSFIETERVPGSSYGAMIRFQQVVSGFSLTQQFLAR